MKHNDVSHGELTLGEHIADLRRTILWSLASIFIAGSFVHYWRNEIIGFILHPLHGMPLQFLSPLDPLMFILTIDCAGGLLLSLPIIIWLVYRFAAPALPTIRSILLVPIIIVPLFLAASAAAYAYYVAIPLTLSVLTSFTVPGIQTSFTAENYLSFFMTALFMLIIVFEVPVVMVLLGRLGLLRASVVARKRKYVYLGLLIAVAVITPTTDLVSLMLILLPTYVVFELGLIGVRIWGR